MTPLEERPDEVVTLRERAEIEPILLQCGLLNQLARSRELPSGRAIAYEHHDTHWLLAARRCLPSGDHFILYALPKNRFTQAKFIQFRDEFARREAPNQRGTNETTDPSDN